VVYCIFISIRNVNCFVSIANVGCQLCPAFEDGDHTEQQWRWYRIPRKQRQRIEYYRGPESLLNNEELLEENGDTDRGISYILSHRRL